LYYPQVSKEKPSSSKIIKPVPSAAALPSVQAPAFRRYEVVAVEGVWASDLADPPSTAPASGSKQDDSAGGSVSKSEAQTDSSSGVTAMNTNDVPSLEKADGSAPPKKTHPLPNDRIVVRLLKQAGRGSSLLNLEPDQGM